MSTMMSVGRGVASVKRGVVGMEKDGGREVRFQEGAEVLREP